MVSCLYQAAVVVAEDSAAVAVRLSGCNYYVKTVEELLQSEGCQAGLEMESM